MSNNYEIFYYGGILVAMKIKKITTNKKTISFSTPSG